jgi:GntR family transcriptional regulator
MSIGDESDPRAYVRLAADVRKAIADGTYPPGSPTPSITTLSQQSGHARQTCSKALNVLVDEGLLIRYPGLGYYVVGSPGKAGSPASPASGSGAPDAL